MIGWYIKEMSSVHVFTGAPVIREKGMLNKFLDSYIEVYSELA